MGSHLGLVERYGLDSEGNGAFMEGFELGSDKVVEWQSSRITPLAAVVRVGLGQMRQKSERS